MVVSLRVRIWYTTLLMFTLLACAPPRLDTTSLESMRASSQAMACSMSLEDSQRFTAAVSRLMIAAGVEAQGPDLDAARDEIARASGGKVVVPVMENPAILDPAIARPGLLQRANRMTAEEVIALSDQVMKDISRAGSGR